MHAYSIVFVDLRTELRTEVDVVRLDTVETPSTIES